MRMGGVKTGVFRRDRFADKTSRSQRTLGNVQMESPSYKRLAAFHAQYLEKHSSPLRARFVYEFGADVAAAMPGVGRADLIAPSREICRSNIRHDQPVSVPAIRG